MTDDPIEGQLQRYRPAGPPVDLRARVLAAAGAEARRATAPAWMAWAAAAVAALCVAAAAWFTIETNRLDARLAEPSPAARAATEDTLRLLDGSPEARAYLRAVLEQERREADARLRQLEGLQ